MTHWPQDDINLLGGANQQQPRSQQPYQAMSPELRHSSSNTSSEGGLKRESFGRARSHPLKVKDSPARPGQSLKFRTSDREIKLTFKRSKSATNLNSTISGVGKDGNRSWTRKLSLGASKEDDKEVYVTRHMLYKEAMYTSIHFLGMETSRFPSDKEKLCMYVHETFSTSEKERQAVIDHVKSELFPLTGVNTQIVKAEGLVSRFESKNPNAYCVVAIEQEGSYGKKNWQNYASEADTSFQKITKIIRKSLDVTVEAAARRVQFYDNVPPPHKTDIKPWDKNPYWDKTFQCVSVHPSTDAIVVEVWDRVEDDTLLKSIDAYTTARRISNPNDNTLPRNSLKSQGQKRLSKNEVKNSDVFLGKVSKRVNEISCEGYEKNIQLEGLTGNSDMMAHGKLKLRLWLVHLYRHGQPYFEMVDKRTMLKCLWDWILSFEKKRNGNEWDGKLPSEANCLLYQYALQTGISEEIHCYIRWDAYAKHKLDIEGLDIPLKDLDGVLKKRQSSLVTSVIDDSHLQIENSILILMEEEIFPIIRNHLREKEELVNKALKSYKNCVDVLSRLEISYTLPIFRGLFEKALRLCFLEWYQGIYALKVHVTKDSDKCQQIIYYVELIGEVNKLLVLGTKKWNPMFWMLAEYEPYMPIMYEELQKMVNHDIEFVCWNVLRDYNSNKKLKNILKLSTKQDECIASAMFSLYAGTQTFVDAKTSIFTDDFPFENLSRYYKWFRPTLVLWLGFAVVRGSEMITRCVNIDSSSLDNIHTKTSTSALDTVTVIHQLVSFWQQLMWPDICEKYIIIHFLIEVICYLTVMYATRKFEKLELEGYFDTYDRFDISERLCTALNNIEYVKEVLEGIPDEIEYEKLLRELEEFCGITKETYAYRMRLKHTLTVTFVNVEIIFTNILSGLENRVRPEVKKCVHECLDSLELELGLDEALDPILSYTDSNIVMLSKSLLLLNFARMLQFFWNIILHEIARQSSALKHPSKNHQYNFFRKILLLLANLRSYFQNGEGGLNDDELDTQAYWETLQIITLFTLDIPDVIAQFYGSRGEEQIEIDEFSKPRFGTLSVRVGYWQGKLSVEVIAASNLVPIDDSFNILKLFKKKEANNDPFVEIELQPEHFFSDARGSKTKTQSKTVNPVFNEKFQWDLPYEEASRKNASIVLTVKDYDYLNHLSGHDFLGEAVIPFNVIPGLSEKPIPQPMHLYLREVEPSVILKILKSRTWESPATRFYERQVKRHVYIKPSNNDNKV